MIDATRTGRQTKTPINQREFEVYARVNEADFDKKYVGKSGMSAKERADADTYKAFNEDDRDYNRSICQAVRKDGKEAFKIKLLATTDNEEVATYLEQCYIDKFQTLNPEFGYNGKRAVSDKRMQELKLTIDISKVKFFCPL